MQKPINIKQYSNVQTEAKMMEERPVIKKAPKKQKLNDREQRIAKNCWLLCFRRFVTIIQEGEKRRAPKKKQKELEFFYKIQEKDSMRLQQLQEFFKKIGMNSQKIKSKKQMVILISDKMQSNDDIRQFFLNSLVLWLEEGYYDSYMRSINDINSQKVQENNDFRTSQTEKILSFTQKLQKQFCNNNNTPSSQVELNLKEEFTFDSNAIDQSQDQELQTQDVQVDQQFQNQNQQQQQLEQTQVEKVQICQEQEFYQQKQQSQALPQQQQYTVQQQYGNNSLEIKSAKIDQEELQNRVKKDLESYIQQNYKSQNFDIQIKIKTIVNSPMQQQQQVENQFCQNSNISMNIIEQQQEKQIVDVQYQNQQQQPTIINNDHYSPISPVPVQEHEQENQEISQSYDLEKNIESYVDSLQTNYDSSQLNVEDQYLNDQYENSLQEYNSLPEVENIFLRQESMNQQDPNNNFSVKFDVYHTKFTLND